jgi:hypothetical protein
VCGGHVVPPTTPEAQTVAKQKRAEPKPDPEPVRMAAVEAFERHLTPEEALDLGMRSHGAEVESGIMRVSDLIRDLRDSAREQRRLAEKLEKAADVIADMKAKYPALKREQKRLEKARAKGAKERKAERAEARKAARRKQAAEDRNQLAEIKRLRKRGVIV